MIKGTTQSGFDFELDDGALDNMELVDALAEASDDNPLAISRVTLLLLGKDQRKRLYDSVRTVGGTVPAKKVMETLSEIFQAAKPAKN